MARERVDNRREFLQLAHTYDPGKHRLNGWLMSDKLDGMRCFWDGGITRGLYAHEVPFANTAKDGIRVNPPKCTGLWSRYGKPVQAPMWWVDELPKFPLDGELYLGPGRFQSVMSTCRKIVPVTEEWEKIKFHAFGMPDFSEVFRDGEIRVPNFEKKITGVIEWLHMQRICKWTPADAKKRRFETVAFLLNREFGHNEHPIVRCVKQTQLPFNTTKTMEVIDAELSRVLDGGGEGLVFQNPNNIWEPQRKHELLKMKPYSDCEVKVRGYIWGKETDKGSKLLGLMGAMIVDYKGKRLELSGFTDAERQMAYIESDRSLEDRLQVAKEIGARNPGKEIDVTHFENPRFPIGSMVTIKYREETDAGLPKEARFFRARPEE